MVFSLASSVSAVLDRVGGSARLTSEQVDEAVADLRRVLLDADVALPVVRRLCTSVQARAGHMVGSRLESTASQAVAGVLASELVEVLGGTAREVRFASGRPTVIVLVGLQGVGKTSLAGKLAARFASQGHRPLLVAADMVRPSAVEQLQVVAGACGAEFFSAFAGSGVGDPVAAAVAGVEHARKVGADVVIVDTAGRLSVDEAMMGQAAQVVAAVSPDEVLLAVDAMTGQSAAEVAAAFNDTVGVDGVVLTKADGDSRGGAVLSVREVTGRPIMFVATGEKVEDLEEFHPDRMASRILDMGDVQTLMEAAAAADVDEATLSAADRLAAGGRVDLNDFGRWMSMVERMGSLGRLASLLPGASAAKAAAGELDESALVRVRAMLSSMTEQERAFPEVLDKSRRTRIAAGAGVRPADVAELVARFDEAVSALADSVAPYAGGGDAVRRRANRRRAAQPARKGKGARRSGNPAVRARQERAGGGVR